MCLGPNFTLHRNSAHQAGVAPIFDRILSELSVKMKRMKMDRSELICLKAIILFNPGKMNGKEHAKNKNKKHLCLFLNFIYLFSHCASHFRYSRIKM